jgi:hypothetical protein
MSLIIYMAPPYHNFGNKILIFITVNTRKYLNYLTIVLFHGTFCGVGIREVRRLKVQYIFRPACPLFCLLSVRKGQRQNHHIKLPGMFNRKLCRQKQSSENFVNNVSILGNVTGKTDTFLEVTHPIENMCRYNQ